MKLKHAFSDAENMAALLRTNADGSANFDVDVFPKLERGTITADGLLDAFNRLLTNEYFDSMDESEDPKNPRDSYSENEGRWDRDLVFYFSGHGQVGVSGDLQLMTSDLAQNTYLGGVPFDLLIRQAVENSNKYSSLTLILDCCFAGRASSFANAFFSDFVILPPNVSVLAACGPERVAKEDSLGGGWGQFTRLLAAGLEGGAANLSGRIGVADLHRFVDENSFDRTYDNGPSVLKSHMASGVALRHVGVASESNSMKDDLMLVDAQEALPTAELFGSSAVEVKSAMYRLIGQGFLCVTDEKLEFSIQAQARLNLYRRLTENATLDDDFTIED